MAMLWYTKAIVSEVLADGVIMEEKKWKIQLRKSNSEKRSKFHEA